MTKYHMHKIERQITDPEAVEAVLQRGQYATLALCREREPYLVTLNYGYHSPDRVLYFHSATEGLKLDFIRENPQVCGTVIEDHGYVQGKCTHAYRSVVFWGEIEVLEDLEEKRAGLVCMIDHLENDAEGVRQRLLSNPTRLAGVAVLRLRIREISGKEGL